jgi:hypothetical protein
MGAVSRLSSTIYASCCENNLACFGVVVNRRTGSARIFLNSGSPEESMQILAVMKQECKAFEKEIGKL